jgi:hypothetical protein
MTHESFSERLLDLAYGELSPREAREVEGHAASCQACRAELAQIRETRRIMAALPEEPAPEQGERILLAAAREAAERRVPKRLLPPWLWGAAAVAASLVAVAAVSYRIVSMRPGPLERPDREALLGESPYAAGAKVPPAPSEPDAALHRSVEASPELEARAGRAASSPAAPAGEVPRRPPPAPEPKREAPARGERTLRTFAEAPPAVADAAPRRADAPSGPPQSAAGVEVLGVPAEGAERLRSLPRPGAAARPATPAPAPRAATRGEDEAAMAALEGEGQPVRGGARAAAKAAEAPSPAGVRALAFATPLRAEVRSFERCEGESSRRVETDAQGRVASYVREGTIAGRRVRITHVYRPDGGLAAVTAEDLDAGGAVVDGRALGIAVPERAEEARIDAPPRCGR